MKRKNEEIVKDLVATGKWSETVARLGIRAGFKCEYCDKNLLQSEDDYKLWQVDHIVPLRAGGDPIKEENLAIACRQCNMDFKSRWNPLEKLPDNLTPTREKLIALVRDYVRMRREKTLKELEFVKKLLKE